jgi:hypothetical protein
LSPSPSPSPAPAPVARGKSIRKPRNPQTEKKQRKKQTSTKITIKLKQPKEKKPLAKPREPKIEPIPRSLTDNFDVPLVALFRAKFRVLFAGTSELGPQDVEEGVSVQGDVEGKLEEFIMRMCNLIGNRRKSVEYELLGECADCRRENLGKVLQEIVDSCFEKYGFRRDGVVVSPMWNSTFATMDWDGRVCLL